LEKQAVNFERRESVEEDEEDEGKLGGIWK